LYGRYDRILIGEIHDKGMYRMLRVMATGGDGSMSTFHAGDAKSALEQVRNHVLLEYPQLPPATVTHFVRSAINIVVVIENIDGKHRIKQIAEVEWRNLSEDNVQIGLNELFAWDHKGERTMNGQPGFISIGRPDENGKLREKAERYGVPLSPEWFPSDNMLLT
jgi:pilus assembly protein CpaF